MIAPPDTIEALDELVAAKGWDSAALKVSQFRTRHPRQTVPPPWHEFAVEARRQGFTLECIADYVCLSREAIRKSLRRWA